MRFFASTLKKKMNERASEHPSVTMPPPRSDRYLHREFLGAELTHRNADGLLAMHFCKDDTLPAFLGMFVFNEETESATLIDFHSRLESSAANASGSSNQGFAGRWIVMDPGIIGDCFTPDTGTFNGELCVVLSPRYFLKAASVTDDLGQTLLSSRPIDQRAHPTKEPQAYIYTTEATFLERSYHFEHYSLDELAVKSSTDVHSLLTSQKVTGYKGPYDIFKDLEEENPSEYPHLQRALHPQPAPACQSLCVCGRQTGQRGQSDRR
jgi:hypothetical protein